MAAEASAVTAVGGIALVSATGSNPSTVADAVTTLLMGWAVATRSDAAPALAVITSGFVNIGWTVSIDNHASTACRPGALSTDLWASAGWSDSTRRAVASLAGATGRRTAIAAAWWKQARGWGEPDAVPLTIAVLGDNGGAPILDLAWAMATLPTPALYVDTPSRIDAAVATQRWTLHEDVFGSIRGALSDKVKKYRDLVVTP